MYAYILITTDAGKVMDVLADIKAIGNVKSAHATIGPYDIIALVEFPDPGALKNLIVDKIQRISGISRTLTLLASE